MGTTGTGPDAVHHLEDGSEGLHENIALLLWRAAAAMPDRTAIIDAAGEHGYAELRARAAAVMRRLGALGVRPGDRVGILLERSCDAAAAFFGVTASGAVAININETLRPRQIEHQLAHARAAVLLASAALLERLGRPLETEAAVVSLDGLSGVPPAGGPVPVRRIATDVAQIIYTSGSTGLPKGVTLSHGNLSAGAAAVSSYLGIGPADRLAGLLPFSFDYGLNQLLVTVRERACLVIERSPVAPRIAATLHAAGVTVLAAVPPLWLQLLSAANFEARPIETLRIMTNTGGRLAPDAVRRLRRAQPQARLFLMYGLTEAFRSTYLPPAEVDRRPDSIGRAIPGAEILVLRDDGSPCAPGEVGELVHRGPTVALGYWDDPDATARVFRPNPLRPPGTPDAERVVFSGDLVRHDEHGFLYFVGRRDALIKTLGYRVSPDEVADALYASGQVAEAVVAAEADPVRGARIVAHVVLREDGSEHRLREHCRRELPAHMQPARFVLQDTLPRTTSGKFDARALAR